MVVGDCTFVFRPGIAAREVLGLVWPPFFVLFLFVKFNFNKTSKKHCHIDICISISVDYLLVIIRFF